MAAKDKVENEKEVTRILRTKKYREIKNDLMKQLELNGTEGLQYEDLVEDYMTMYVTKTLLAEDIRKRGTPVKYDNGGGQKGYRKNDSIELFHKTNAQMLKLLSELGIKASAAPPEADDEL